MSDNRNPDLESCLNTLSFHFSATEKEVHKINANMTTINANIHSSIDIKMKNKKNTSLPFLHASLAIFVPK
jgi:hypothetical protein